MANGENKSGRPSKSGSKAFTEIFRKLIGEATQQEAAEKIGVTRQNVGRWLAGMNTPDIEALEKIADAYEVSTDYLLGRTNAKTSDIEIRTICDYLGLNDKEIELIKYFSGSECPTPNNFRIVLNSEWFKSFLENLDERVDVLQDRLDSVMEDSEIVRNKKSTEEEKTWYKDMPPYNRYLATHDRSAVITLEILQSLFKFIEYHELQAFNFLDNGERRIKPTHADHKPTEE